MKYFLDKKKAWTRHAAYQVAGIYLLAAGLWELVAHRFLSGIYVEYGEWAFVLASAALLAWLVQRNLGTYRRREQKLREITHWLSVERRRAEEELRNSEALLRTVFDQAFQLMGLMKPDGTLIKINRSAADSIRTDVATVLNRPFWETPWWAHSPELQERLRAAIREAAEGKLVRFEATHPSPGGELAYVDFSIKPVLDSIGRVILLVPEGRDITESRRAEQALRASEERFRSVFNAAAAGMVIISQDNLILHANPAFCQFTGYSEAELADMTIEDVTHPEDRKRTWQAYRELLAGKAENIHYEKRYLRKDGRMVWGHASVACLIGRVGTPGYCVGLVQDITERKRAEEEIETLNATLAARAFELELANRELEAFNYTVSHDLRKPLTVISGYCQVIQESCGVRLDEQCRSYLAEILHGTCRMAELINTLLKFAQVGRCEIQPETVDLSGIATKIAAELRLGDLHRRVSFRVAEGAAANGDPQLLRLVLENLLGNAWKFTVGREEASIEFGVTEVSGRRTFFVRDNGPGFDMADADRLFMPFQRLPGTAEVAGHGIGLATVQRIIQRHGGCVWAEGEEGKGATFYFVL